jgi:hypothetical protein
MEKLKNIKPKEVFTGLAVLLVLFIAYQALVVVPQKNLEKKMSEERREASAKELKYTFCMVNAAKSYDNLWESNCDSFSVGKDGDSCLLPSRIADNLNDKWADDKKTCLTLYK